MNNEQYKLLLKKLLDEMTGYLYECEPEFKTSTVNTILDLADRIIALDRKF